jgi:O-acetyl-ADP-ribose deacetylase (regulator of RNase III)
MVLATWVQLPIRNQKYYSADVAIDGEIDSAFGQLWEKVCRDVLPEHAETDWDFVKAEFWPDSGRIIVFPAPNSLERIDRAGCQLVVHPLLRRWDEMADSEDDDESFDARVSEELHRLAERLLKMLKEVVYSAKSDCWSLLPKSPLIVRCFNAEEHVPFDELRLRQ